MATERQTRIMKTTSPYDNNISYWGINGVLEIHSHPFNYVPSDNDVLHTVLPGETLQHIAYKYYKDSGYWYIIADANEILNPFKEVVEGMILVIPDQNSFI